MVKEAELFDGTVLEFPDNTPPDVISRVAKERTMAMRSDPYHSSNVDWNSGADMPTRAYVGHHDDQQKRLEIMQKLHPGAVQYGEDNFLYPTKDGKVTLYNPSGFDRGDLAENGKVITQLAGGVAATPLGLIGSSAAAAGAGQGYDYLLDKMLNDRLQKEGQASIGYKPITQAAKEMGIETAAGAALGKGAEWAIKGLNPVSQRLMSYWKELGVIPPSIGAVSESKFIQMIENGLSNMLGSAGKMEAAGDAGRAALGGKVSEVARQISPQMLQGETLGGAVRQAYDGVGPALRAESASRFEPIMQAVGDQAASVPETRQAIVDEMLRLDGPGRRLSNTAKDYLSDATGVIQPVLKDDAAGNLNINALFRQKNKISDAISDKARGLSVGRSIDDALYQKLEGTLSNDVAASIHDVDPLAGAEFDAAKQWYKGEADKARLLDKLFGGAKTDKDFLTKVSPRGTATSAEALDVIKQRMGSDAYNQIVGNLLENMGKSQGAEIGSFSPALFDAALNGKNGLTPEARALIQNNMSAAQASTIDAVEEASKGLNQAGKVYNSSKTAGTMGTQQDLNSVSKAVAAKILGNVLPAAGGGYYGYEHGGAAGGFAGLLAGLGGARAMAALHTNPWIVKILGSEGLRKFAEGRTPTSSLLREIGVLPSKSLEDQY